MLSIFPLKETSGVSILVLPPVTIIPPVAERVPDTAAFVPIITLPSELTCNAFLLFAFTDKVPFTTASPVVDNPSLVTFPVKLANGELISNPSLLFSIFPSI